MDDFKRNQVEEAIAAAFGRRSSRKSWTTLRTRLKRLLDTDRSLGRQPRSSKPELAFYAFYSTEAPGSGVEIWFSHYEAFALCMAWCLLEHGWPQASAVSMLRKARPNLEKKHAEILNWDPKNIFDDKKVRDARRPGSLNVDTTHPVYFVIASRTGRPVENSTTANEVKILDEIALMRFMKSEAGLFLTQLELVKTAHDLKKALKDTNPVKRGRGST